MTPALASRLGVAVRDDLARTYQFRGDLVERARIVRGGDLAPPLHGIQLEATALCNLRCPFCMYWGDRGSSFRLIEEGDARVAHVLSKEEIVEMLAPFAVQPGGFHVYLSGGEPFARHDTVDLIEALSRMGLTVSLTTNATLLTPERIHRLVRAPGMRALTVSLDGPRAQHDAVRGRGNFDRTVGNVRAIVEERDRLGLDHPRVWFNATMNPSLVGHVRELAEVMRDAGASEGRIQHFWWVDARTLDRHRRDLAARFGEGAVDDGASGHLIDPAPGPAYGRAAAREIAEARRAVYPFKFYPAPNLTEAEAAAYYTDASGFTKVRGCTKPWVSCLVRADGTVVVCPDEWVNYVIGDVRKESLLAIWHGERARRFRAEVKRELMPACARCCWPNLRVK